MIRSFVEQRKDRMKLFQIDLLYILNFLKFLLHSSPLFKRRF